MIQNFQTKRMSCLLAINYGKKSFHAIFAKILNKKISDLRSKGGIFAPHTFSGNDKKNDMKFNSLISKKNQVKITNELANNIDIC